MPGGMGGMGGMGGGLLGSLMKGAMGGGGMRGGMGGMGGMNQNAGGQTQAAESIVDDYDVARWQRADGLDVVPTMVQTVRADWEKKQTEKQERSPLKRLLSKFSRKKKPKAEAASEPEPRPTGGTIVAPEMKKASQRINTAAEREVAAQPSEPPKRPVMRCNAVKKNYLGLSFQTEIDGFFTSNPVNSAILAVDSLGLGIGALTLNQIRVTPEAEAVLAVDSGVAPQEIADQMDSPREQAGGLQNLITQRTDTNYMNEFHKSREQQKYNVRIRD